MNYYGTSDNDVISQSLLGLPDWSNIYGENGDDTITIGSATAIGGPGNDTIIGITQSTVAYWGSPSGIDVNLATGTAKDGYGTLDTLKNINTVHGTPYDDHFIGSAGNDTFWGLGGNDTIVGGGGNDTVVFWKTKFSDANISYDASTDTFTIKATDESGNTGTNVLQGINTISFRTSNYQFDVNKYDVGSFKKISSTSFSKTQIAFINAVKTGDFNGDGIQDLLLVQQVGSGTTPAQELILLGDAKSNFTDGTSSVFSSNVGISNPGGGRTLIGDFNRDGISDIFQLGFGTDAPPFPGGLNQLFLSSKLSGKLEDVSNTLSQTLQQNHGGSIGDVNGDGYPDILIDTTGNGNFLLINDDSGHFINRTDLLPNQVINSTNQSMTNTVSGLIDVNGDGKKDIILGKWDGESSTPFSEVIINDGNGNFSESSPISLPSSGVYKESVLNIQPIDLNGDQLPDLMLDITSGGVANTITGVVSDTYYTTPYIQLLVNDGNGHFHDETNLRLPQPLQGNSSWYLSLQTVDFNHDGHPDILATSFAGQIPSIAYLNNGDGTFSKVWQSTQGGTTVAEDVNNDGMPDLVTVTDIGSTYTVSVNQNNLVNGHAYIANWGGENLVGSSGNDTFRSHDSINNFDGGFGFDTAIYDGNASSYQITYNQNGSFTVKNNITTDNLTNVERLQFFDKKIAIDLSPIGSAGQTVEIINAAFGKLPLTTHKDYVGIGLSLFDNGNSMQQVAQLIVNNDLISTNYKSFVDTVWNNLFGSTIDSANENYYVGLLTNHTYGLADILALAAQTIQNQQQVDLIGLSKTGIEYA